MTYEEELRDAGRYLYADPLERADWIRDELRDSFACQTCGSPDPAIIEGRFCGDCKGEDHQRFLDTRVTRLAREATNGRA